MQPQEPIQHPIDYLDSIATASKKTGRGSNDILFFAAIGAGIVVVLIVGLIALFGLGTSVSDDFSSLSARLKSLETIADDAKKNTISSRMRGTNTNLALALTNANRDIGTYLTELKIDSKKTPAEDNEALTKALEDARLNGIFDRTYAREMTYQLETTLIMIDQLESKTRSSAQKEFLTTTYKNLEPLKEQFSAFNAASN